MSYIFNPTDVAAMDRADIDFTFDNYFKFLKEAATISDHDRIVVAINNRTGQIVFPKRDGYLEEGMYHTCDAYSMYLREIQDNPEKWDTDRLNASAQGRILTTFESFLEENCVHVEYSRFNEKINVMPKIDGSRDGRQLFTDWLDNILANTVGIS